MTFTFDYHKEPGNSFLGWMLVKLVMGLTEDAELWEKIQAETEGFSNVKLTMQINGIEVPVDKFIDGIENNMQHYAEKAAAEKIEAATEINEISEELDQLKHVLRARTHAIADKYGIPLYYDEE